MTTYVYFNSMVNLKIFLQNLKRENFVYYRVISGNIKILELLFFCLFFSSRFKNLSVLLFSNL